MPAVPNATNQIDAPARPLQRDRRSRAAGLRRTSQVSVRGRLVRLAALLLLPCLALSALLTWQVYQTARLGVETALREAASGLAQVLEREFVQADVLLRTLAATDELKRGDIAALDRLARTSRVLGGAIVLVDEAGQELLDTALPAGVALPRTERSKLPPDAQAGTPTVLPLQRARQGGLQLRVALPLAWPSAAGVHHPAELWLAVPAASLQALLTGQVLPSGWRSSILDPAGRIAARNVQQEHYLGAHATPGLSAAIAANRDGVSDGVALDGTPVVLAFDRSARTGWSVVVATPRRLAGRAGRSSSTLLAVLGSATVLAGLLGAIRVAGGIARPVEALAQATRVLGQDGSWTPIPQGLAEADAVARAMMATASVLRERQAQLGEANVRLQDRVEARTSELARANLALDEQRRFLAVILDQLPAGILVHDSGGRLTFANVAAQSLLSLTGGGVAGAGWPAASLPGEDSPTALACAGVATERSLLGMGTSEGGTMDLEVSASPLRDADGVVIAAVTILQDVTARLQAEEARRRSQRLEAVGQLTGGVAHEFNNLLMAISGCLELLARPVATLGNARAASLLDNATRAAGRGSRLTSQLLAFARRQVLQMEHVDLSALVSGMQDLLEGTLGRGIKVKVLAEPCEWLARADAAQIELMLLNLAINARDAMPNGGSLTIQSACVRTGQPSRAEDPPPGEYAVLQVCDNGEGMSQAVLARVFEPFFTTKAAGRGTGLGLPQVLGVARQMGGGVTIASAPGAGTTVSVYFPRAVTQEAVTQTPQPAPAVERRLAGARVLLVDDDTDVRLVARAILEEMGGTVIEADSGAAALLVLRTRSVDLVLADLTMPKMSGVELAAEVAAIAPALPVVVMTGYGLDTLAETEGHVAATLQKPFRAETLAGILARVLGQDAGSDHFARS